MPGALSLSLGCVRWIFVCSLALAHNCEVDSGLVGISGMWPLWSGHGISLGEFLVLTARGVVSSLHLHCGAHDEKPQPEGLMALGAHRERRFSWPENQPAPNVYRAQKMCTVPDGGKVGSVRWGEPLPHHCFLRGAPPASGFLIPQIDPIHNGFRA